MCSVTAIDLDTGILSDVKYSAGLFIGIIVSDSCKHAPTMYVISTKQWFILLIKSDFF